MKPSISLFLLPLTVLLATGPAQAFSRVKSTEILEKKGALKIPKAQCQTIESQLGQLLYVNADNFDGATDDQDKDAIHPLYVDMVKDLNIGGIIFHSDSNDPLKIRKSAEELKKVAPSPLLIGVDEFRLFEDKDDDSTLFGLGYSYGFVGRNGGLPKECLSRVSYLDAILHAGVGINHSLGPTVEHNTSDDENEGSSPGVLKNEAKIVEPVIRQIIEPFDSAGVFTTFKHYPYIPEEFNLHNEFRDVKSPWPEVEKRLEIFRRLAKDESFMMSTHLFNSLVDPKYITTFSPTWVNYLRNVLGFKGILITDGLFMIENVEKSKAGGIVPLEHMIASWPHNQIPLKDNVTIFALLALRSGHDMVFLESRRDITYRVFNNLLGVACNDKPVSAEIRQKIAAAYTKITTFKNANAEKLRFTPKISNQLIEKAARLYNDNAVCRLSQKDFQNFKMSVDPLLYLSRPSK